MSEKREPYLSEKREPYSKAKVKVTPAMAQAWIDELNKTNYRRASPTKVAEFADLMKAKRWFEPHPDAIQFDWFGNIGNGQHRLLAIVSSGETVEFYIERGIDPEAFNFTDKNRPRSGADDLEKAGFRQDVSAQRAFAIASRMLMGLGTMRPLSIECKEFALRYENLIGTVCIEARSAKPYRSEVIAAFCKATFEHDQTRVLESVQRYASQRFSGALSDPLRKLHEKVVQFRVHGGKPQDMYGFAVSAIRADLENRKLANLYIATQDFVGPWEEGHIPAERRERARKAATTAKANIREGDVMAKAADTLEKARRAGVTFAVVQNMAKPKFPQGTTPVLMRAVNGLAPEIAMLIQKENGIGPLAPAPLPRPRFADEVR